MKYKWLKWTRAIIALIFFVLISFIFIDFRNIIKEDTISGILWLQFIPSFLKFITLFSLASTGFIFVIVLTVIFGRIYCSAVCPLGILQDLFIRAGRLFNVRKRFKYRKPSFILRNIIFALVVLSVFTGSIIFVNVLDPYSMYGKFANGLLKPVGIWINNILSSVLETRGVYYLYHILGYKSRKGVMQGGN